MKRLIVPLLLVLLLCVPVFSQGIPQGKGKPVQVATSQTATFFVYPNTAFRTADTVVFRAMRLPKDEKVGVESLVMANCKTRFFMLIQETGNSERLLAHTNSAMHHALNYVCALRVVDITDYPLA